MIVNSFGMLNVKNSPRKTQIIKKKVVPFGDAENVLLNEEQSLRIENKVTEENTNLSEIKDIILECKDSFQNFKDESYSNLNTLNNKINMIDKILTENYLLKSQINQLENKIEIMERRLIANDVVIDGIPENKLENCAELVQQIGY